MVGGDGKRGNYEGNRKRIIGEERIDGRWVVDCPEDELGHILYRHVCVEDRVRWWVERKNYEGKKSNQLRGGE